MESWKERNQERPAERKCKNAATTLGVVLLVMIGASAWIIGSQISKKNKAMSSWHTEVSQLEEAKTSLNGELVTLEGEYEAQILENTELKDDLTTRIAEVDDLEKKVRSAQSQLSKSKANSEEIKMRLAQIEDLKAELEKDVSRLTGENTALTETNTILTETIISAKREVEMLNEHVMHLSAVNSKLNERLAAIAPAGFTADRFAIVPQKRNDKLTSKASRADVINVSFSLSDVPADYARTHDIYLVFTDFNGTPVKQVKSSNVIVRTSDSVLNISAADAKKIKVAGDQTVKMQISPEDDLDPGMYNLVVYADNGFLGATGFQLR
jgi:predicted RNase H-like nuclease (RuvC/YqgF family)